MKPFNAEILKFIKNFKLEDYLNRFRLEYREAGNSENLQYVIHTCPFCNGVNHKGNFHKYRFYISSENKQFICHGCGERGSLFKFVAKIEVMTVKKAFEKYLSKDFFEALPDELKSLIIEQNSKEDKPLQQIQLPEEFKIIFPFNNLFADGYRYLKQRDILDKNTIQNFDIRWCERATIKHSDGKIVTIKKRIIFPIKMNNEIVGYQGRDITGLAPNKYYISEGFKKSKAIYNYDRVFNAEQIVIVEGVIDLFKCINYNPVGLFGKIISSYQLKLLQKMPNLKSIIIALDPDTKIPDRHGKVAYNEMIEILKDFWEVREIDMPSDKDAGDYSIKQMDEILSKSYPYKKNGLVILL